jgi:D-aminopeptidase
MGLAPRLAIGSGVRVLVEHGRLTLIKAVAKPVAAVGDAGARETRRFIEAAWSWRIRTPRTRDDATTPSPERAMTSSRRAASRAVRAQRARSRVLHALHCRSVTVDSRYGCSSPTHLVPGVTRMCAARDTVVRRV